MYRLTYFGAAELPQYDVEFSNAPAPAPARLTTLVGSGVYDADGLGVARQVWPQMLRYTCVAAGSSIDDPLEQVNGLKAVLGSRRKLWRTTAETVTGVPAQWAWARLVEVDDQARTRA